MSLEPVRVLEYVKIPNGPLFLVSFDRTFFSGYCIGPAYQVKAYKVGVVNIWYGFSSRKVSPSKGYYARGYDVLVNETRGIKEEHCFGKFKCKLQAFSERSFDLREQVSSNHLF